MYRPILITAACLCIGLTPVSASAPQSQKSETIVYIGGEKFYIHTVQPGQTLYSIARLYGVSEQTLVAYNPTMADVLKADQNVKIPVPAPQMQPDEAPLTARQEKKLRKSSFCIRWRRTRRSTPFRSATAFRSRRCWRITRISILRT
ncbi:MAG: LysM peptidoglycan-binding domain-containing protein [Alistipes communis]